MRCRSCLYSLEHLAEERCPECGRAFDPDDPHSILPDVEYEPTPVHNLVLSTIIMLMGAGVIIATYTEWAHDSDCRRHWLVPAMLGTIALGVALRFIGNRRRRKG